MLETLNSRLNVQLRTLYVHHARLNFAPQQSDPLSMTNSRPPIVLSLKLSLSVYTLSLVLNWNKPTNPSRILLSLVSTVVYLESLNVFFGNESNEWNLSSNSLLFGLINSRILILLIVTLALAQYQLCIHFLYLIIY